MLNTCNFFYYHGILMRFSEQKELCVLLWLKPEKSILGEHFFFYRSLETHCRVHMCLKIDFQTDFWPVPHVDHIDCQLEPQYRPYLCSIKKVTSKHIFVVDRRLSWKG